MQTGNVVTPMVWWIRVLEMPQQRATDGLTLSNSHVSCRVSGGWKVAV